LHVHIFLLAKEYTRVFEPVHSYIVSKTNKMHKKILVLNFFLLCYQPTK